MTQEAFKRWWYNEGSQAPYTHHDCEEHTMRMCEIAWNAAVRAEQEPVAWMDADGNVSDNNDHKCFPIPLYTTPPQRTEQPAQQEPMVYEAVWSGGPTNKDYEDAMRLKRLNQLATSPQRRPLTEEDCRTGFREQDAKWTFRNMTAWQVWRTACEWNEAAHGIKENT